ncbi:aminopeptidase N-like [Diachasma alloeum]|uniref:aminopeptidase N-like n=1 Tax=Diachasma alloeum TaxID=454923 RepID=UPI0007381054|nr:aminopeptidase N-like [Diachasma alloeum]
MVRTSAWKRTKAYIRRMRGNKAGGWIALLLLLILGKVSDSNANIDGSIDSRLPKNSVPSSYEIKIEPHMIPGNFTFNGEEDIVLAVLEESSEITLHAHSDLFIKADATVLIGKDGKSVKPKNHIQQNSTDFLMISFESKIAAGNYTLHLEFIGKINNGTDGVFRSSYLKDKNENVWFIATRFSRIFARRAFPCWDEPALKATFNLSLKHYPNYTAASNMPIRRKVETGDGKVWTNFQITPKMSTYTIAFVVSDLSCISNTNKLLNMCAVKQALPGLKLAQVVQDKALALFNQYTGMPFPLPKLDSYILPHEQRSGSLDSWGLILDRESRMVMKDDSPYCAKEYATLLLIHGLAYQSLVNLVSPIWWTDVWLNEGLVQYLRLYIENQMHPEWDLINEFVADTSLSRDRKDWLSWEPKKFVDEKFKVPLCDYIKSAAVMHMLSNTVSKEVFQEGVRIYFKKYQYGAASPDDFWSVMQETYDKAQKTPKINIKDIMNSWTSQTGYPMVKVVRDYEAGTVTIHHPNKTPSQPSSRWFIPINYAIKSHPNFASTVPTHWLKPGDGQLVIDGLNKDDWIIVNIQQSGYYGVDYDDASWEKIIQYLNSKDYTKIHVLNRAQFVSDLFHGGNYMTLLKLTSYLSRETELIPWRAGKLALSYFKHHLSDDAELQQNLNKYVQLLMKRVLEEVGFEDRPSDSNLVKKKRSELMNLASKFNNTKCLEAQSKKALAHLEGRGYQSLDYWQICYGASDEKVASLLEKKIEDGNTEAYFSARSCSRNTTFYEKFIKKIASNQTIAKNTTRLAIIVLAEKTVEGWDWGINYYMQHFDQLLKDYGQTDVTFMLNHYIQRAATPQRLEKIAEFINEHQDHFEASVKEELSKKSKMFEWSKTMAPLMNDWLKQQLILMAETTKA